MHQEPEAGSVRGKAPKKDDRKREIRPFDPTKIQLSAADNAFIQWYDARCKRILSNRMLLAHLLRATMHEFEQIEPEVIGRRYIEGTPGKENHSKNIQGLRNERDDPKRHPSFFDIIFYALLPKSEESIPIFINVEPQSVYRIGYDLRNRALFYASCMLADQKDSVFERSNYDDLRKVCSIWVCMDPPEDCANTIMSYSLEQHDLFGDCPEHPFDKLQIVLVHIGSAKDKNYEGIMPLLDACLSKKVSADYRKAVSEQYNVHLEQEDYDMTAGEQIIYDLKRQIWEEGEKKWIDGKDEEKRTIAKAMKTKDIDVNTISECTGLTSEEIAAL